MWSARAPAGAQLLAARADDPQDSRRAAERHERHRQLVADERAEDAERDRRGDPAPAAAGERADPSVGARREHGIGERLREQEARVEERRGADRREAGDECDPPRDDQLARSGTTGTAVRHIGERVEVLAAE